MANLLQDLRYASRVLARNPSVTAVVVITLALGIGANTAIFSLIDAVLLKSLPVDKPEQLVVVSALHSSQPRDFSYPMFRELVARQEVFSGVLATGSLEFLRVRVEGDGDLEADQIQGRFVSANYFSVLGVQPALGRTFTGEAEPAVVISHRFWERQFGRDIGVPGRGITLNHVDFAIVGVAPREFFGDSVGMAPDLWVPIETQPLLSSRNLLEVHTATWFRTMARLKPGVSEREAAGALTGLYRQLVQQEAASGRGSRIHQAPRPEEIRVEVEPGSKGLAGLRRQFSKPLQLLMAVVALVLLMACCNVANLLLARATARQKEISIRLAIGGGRLRIMRQLLTESLVLAVLGGSAGLIVAFHGVTFLAGLFSVQLDLQPDWRVLGFTALVSLLAGILFGLMPALQASSLDLNSALKESGQAHSGGPSRHRLSKGLVVFQLALTFVLLVGVGLLLRTLQNFQDLDAGFNRKGVLLVEVRPDSSALKAEELPVLAEQMLERLNTVPGVRSASLSAMPPLSGGTWTAPVRVPQSGVDPAADGEVRLNPVSSRYFETLGMGIMLGRSFGPHDTATSPKVAVINETMARHYFPDEDPLGKLVYFPKLDAQGRYVPFEEAMGLEQAVEIVGVARDAKYDNLRQTTPRMVYLLWPQKAGLLSSIEIRTQADPSVLEATVRKAIAEVSPYLVVRNVKTLQEQVNSTLSQERLIGKLLSLFAMIAVMLACVGLYGVVSYSVVRRTREIGIRIALGARSSEMAAMVLRESMLLAALGLAMGMPAALFSTHLIEWLLFDVKPTDLETLMFAALVMLCFAGAVAYLPARKAARVDPMEALRYE